MTSTSASSTDSRAWQPLFAQLDAVTLYPTGESFNASTSPKTHYLLSDAGIIEIRGIDAATFLQGQLTVDCVELSQGGTQWAAHCSPQGRVISSFFLHKVDDQCFLLLLPANNVANALAALNKYAVFSKVKIDDLSNTFCAVGHQHTQCFSATHCLHINDNLSISLMTWADSETIGKTLLELPHEALGGSINWKTELITAGISLIESHCSGEHVAQMLNMDLLDGISFTKGCYTGQEVIARLKYKGEAKRRCYRLSINHDVHTNSGEHIAVKAGQIISKPRDGQRDDVLGQVITASVDGNRIHALAVLKTAFVSGMGGSEDTLGFTSADTPDDGKNLAVVIHQNLPPYAIN